MLPADREKEDIEGFVPGHKTKIQKMSSGGKGDTW